MRNHSILARIIFFVVLFAAARAQAKQEVVLNRGFDAGKSYAMGGVDAIDAMSGNLVVSVPLGAEYGSNGTLSYKFGLTYNSNIWDHVYNDGTGILSGEVRLTYDEYVDTFYRITEAELNSGASGTEAFPSYQFNAGLGWTATLGDLEDGFVYVAEDGSEHRFYGKLHGDTSEEAFPATGPYYTRDGSYLRMTKTKTGETDSERMIEFPNGIQKRFTCNAGCTTNPFAVWRLSEIADPFGNLLYVSYGEPNGNGDYTVTYEQRAAGTSGQVAYYARPSHTATVVRTHTLTYRRVNPWDVRLISATLAGPGGTTATYQFIYDERTLYRDHGSTWAGPDLRVPFNDATNHSNNKIDVGVLREVQLPAAAGSWQFSYKEITPSSPDADLVEVVWGEGANARHYFTSQLDGRLTSVTLPTGGRTEYTYAPRAIPARKCKTGRAENGPVGSLGVSTKTTYDRGSSVPKGVWRYYLSRYRSDAQLPATQCNFAKELVATVVSPGLVNTTGAPASALGASVQVSYFSVYWDNANYNDGQPWDPTEYGSPVTKAVGDGDGRYLSRQTYQCATADVFEDATPAGRDAKLRKLLAHHRSAGEAATCGAPLRSTYVRHENSGLDCDDAVVSDCRQALRRVASEKTIEHGDGTASNPDTYVTMDYSDYDGLGHYRLATEGGNIYRTIFPSSGTDAASSYTRYNPLVTYNPGTKTLSHPTVAVPDGLRWVLDLYDRTVQRGRDSGKTTGPENVATSEFVFNADTGMLVRRRTWAGTAEGETTGGRTAGDFVTVLQRTSEDATTARVTASFYGGDDQATLSVTQNLDVLGLPSSPEYVIDRRYKHGGLRLAQYLKCDGTSVAYTIEDNVVDGNTGLVIASTDNSGLTTTFGYDVLGRVTSLKVPGDTETTKSTYSYTAATSASAASAVASRGSGTDQTRTVTYFDGFGRPETTESQVPDDKNGNHCNNCYNQQTAAYDALGRREWSSVVVAKTGAGEVNASRKTYFWYDMFGRTVKTKAPDGAQTTATYFGNWHVQSKTDTLGNVDEFHDRRGRVVKVSRGSGPTYRYEYDSSDRLRRVFRFPDTERATFTYDNRGLLTSEQQPEMNRGTIRYTYDSRGNLLSRAYPTAAAQYDLEYSYDETERIVDVKHGALSLKHYDYYPNGAGKAGKLSLATRTNHVLAQGPVKQYIDYEVVQAFGYKPTTGQVETIKTTAGRRTANGVTGMFASDQKYEYDGYGKLSALHYPNTCANGGCERVVTLGYHNDKLTSVRGSRAGTVTNYLSDVFYHPNGMYRRTLRGNGTRDDLSLDAITLLPRPQKIEFSKNNGALALGVFGPIVYNGAGHITDVTRSSGASDTFQYDDQGRLTNAEVSGRSQVIDFDDYGNIDQITTGSTIRNLATNDTNNHLAMATYDDAGYMKNVPDKRSGSPAGAQFAFDWDAAGNLSRMAAPNLRRAFLYDVNDERIGTLDYEVTPQKETQLWTVRGGSGPVLSEFTRVADLDTGAGTLLASRDYVFGIGGNAAAAIEIAASGAESVRHFHNDHLGTPRVISDSAGLATTRDYLPFGEEVFESNAPGRLEFTGQERDDDGTLAAGSEGDFDYMHARYYAPWLGRFLSRDAVKGGNAYVYASNNPMAYTDPSGMDPTSFGAGYSWSWYEPTRSYEETITVVGTSDPSVGSFIADWADGVGYDVAEPMLEVASGIINNDPGLMAKGEGKMLSAALLQLGIGRVLAWSRTSPSAVARFLNTPLGGAKAAPPMSPPVPEARIFNEYGMTMFGEEVEWAPGEVPNIRVPENTSFDVVDETAPKILSPYGTGTMVHPVAARFEAGEMMPDFVLPRLGGVRISQVIESGLPYTLRCTTPRATMLRSFVWPRGPIPQNPTGVSILDLFRTDD